MQPLKLQWLCMTNLRGRSRGKSWSIWRQGVIPELLWRDWVKPQNTCQDSQCLGRYSSPGPPEYKALYGDVRFEPIKLFHVKHSSVFLTARSSYYPSIFLRRLRKTMEYISQDNRSSKRDSNLEPPLISYARLDPVNSLKLFLCERSVDITVSWSFALSQHLPGGAEEIHERS
jgi:hypothetical protein